MFDNMEVSFDVKYQSHIIQFSHRHEDFIVDL